jgi:alkanesulfonate monooxygenase SsuD/methylene tetrahydromethanopterin reductase-like flavin-dependent oxidoreductase (luciferase family)
MPTTLPPPSREFAHETAPFGQIPLAEIQSVAMIGAPETVREGLESFIARTAPDEVMVHTHVYDHAARLRSYELLAELAA